MIVCKQHRSVIGHHQDRIIRRTSELLSSGRRMRGSGTTRIGQILDLSLGIGELGFNLLSDRALEGFSITLVKLYLGSQWYAKPASVGQSVYIQQWRFVLQPTSPFCTVFFRF